MTHGPQDRFLGTAVPEPGFADDDGHSDPGLVAALVAADGTPDAEAAVSAALVGARLLVPVVAVLDAAEQGEGGLRREKSSHMATVEVLAPDGRRALLAFTGTDALAAWDPAARPVATTATRAAQAALAEGAAALLVDGGSGPHALAGVRLAALAQGRAWVPPWRDTDIAAALHDVLLAPGRDEALASVVAVRLLPDDGLTVLLEVEGEPAAADAAALAVAASRALGGVGVLGQRCPAGISVGVASR